METLTTALVYLSTLPSAFQFILLLLIAIIAIRNLLDYENYKSRRKLKTSSLVIGFAESILNNILSDAIQNMRQIMIETRNGELTQDDKIELNLCRLASANSLLIETKHKIKDIIRDNGYYKLVKSGQDISLLVSTRAKELRDISRSSIDNIIRHSSPLQGVSEKRFSITDSEKLFKSIVDKHILEIDNEIKDIEEYGKSKLWLFYKLIPYDHDEE